MTYLDGNNKDVPNETAVITGIAKQDLSNINNGGKTVIKTLLKKLSTWKTVRTQLLLTVT